jgi:hypothetical protein
MLTISCKACSEQFMVSDEMVGEKATCPACGRAVLVEAPVEVDEGPIVEGAWEYRVLADHGRMGHIDEVHLNRAGRQGWELVAVFKEGPESNTRFFFKRPLKKPE